MPQQIIFTLEQLRNLIGLCVYHQDSLCQVIEILEDGPALVLQRLGAQAGIQTNQHGDPTRLAPITYTIPILNQEKTQLHPDFVDLDLQE